MHKTRLLLTNLISVVIHSGLIIISLLNPEVFNWLSMNVVLVIIFTVNVIMTAAGKSYPRKWRSGTVSPAQYSITAGIGCIISIILWIIYFNDPSALNPLFYALISVSAFFAIFGGIFASEINK